MLLNRSHKYVPLKIGSSTIPQVIRNGLDQQLHEGSPRAVEKRQALIHLCICSPKLISMGIQPSFHFMFLPFGNCKCLRHYSRASQRSCPLKAHPLHFLNLKRNDTNELIYKIETDSQTQKMNLLLPGGKGGRKGQLGSLGLTCTHCYI